VRPALLTVQHYLPDRANQILLAPRWGRRFWSLIPSGPSNIDLKGDIKIRPVDIIIQLISLSAHRRARAPPAVHVQDRRDQKSLSAHGIGVDQCQ